MKKSPSRIAAVAAIAGLALLSEMPGAWAQQKGADAKQQIVGVWKLISSTNTSKEGVVTQGISFGPNPLGQLIFTASGHYSTVNTNPNIPVFASGNRMKGTPDEYKAVVHGSIAAFGTYSVSADGKELTLKQVGGTWAVRNGKEEKRGLAVAGDDLKYTTAATVGGTSVLTYKRVK